MSIRNCVRCSAGTKQGRGPRCKNITCIYSEFCAQHTKALFKLAIKKSNINNADKGLFTMKAIKKGQKIAKYTGVIKTQAQYDASDSGYGIAVAKNKIMDGASTQSALGRYANNCRASNKKAGECGGNNAKFSINNRTSPPTIWLKATRNIPAGGEIFVPYGRSYW